MSRRSISRAPFHIKYSRKTDFEPEFVSIGPYYYEKLKENKHIGRVKDLCTEYFLRQLPGSSTTPREISDLVGALELQTEDAKKIRDWYGGEIDIEKDDELLRRLVHDSCFLIRIILSLSREVHESMFFQLALDIKKVRFDLLLLENQIPFFFLFKVYDFFDKMKMLPEEPTFSSDSEARDQDQSTSKSRSLLHFLPTRNSSSHSTTEQKSSLHSTTEQTPSILGKFLKELEPFICLDMPWQLNDKYQNNGEPDHLLDLYWKCCLPHPWNDHDADKDPGHDLSNEESTQGQHRVPLSWVEIHLRNNAPKQIKNACQLHEIAGITFEKREHDRGFGVTFQYGVLQLPHLQLDPSRAKLLVNLIAFEELKHSKVRVFTSYVLLLDGLINTEKDVELLQRHGVISNKLGSSQAASAYFNDIGHVSTINYKGHYCHKQFDALNTYHSSYFNRQFATLRHKYFGSPWTVISLVAGVMLLVLTALQTYYNIASYYQHP